MCHAPNLLTTPFSKKCREMIEMHRFLFDSFCRLSSSSPPFLNTCFATETDYILGFPDNENRYRPEHCPSLSGLKLERIVGGQHHSIVLDKTGCSLRVSRSLESCVFYTFYPLHCKAAFCVSAFLVCPIVH